LQHGNADAGSGRILTGHHCGGGFHPPYVEELSRRAVRLGFDTRVRACVGDMSRLPFRAGQFDVLWSEGAIYVIGFDAGLQAWHAMLRPGGHVAVSELCWLESEPPLECLECFASEYPAMRTLAANRAAVERSGYELVGDFSLPPLAWWHDYYEPLERNLAAFTARHPGDSAAETIARQSEHEIETSGRYSDCYGYVFFVMRRRGD
jgi:SAM-dependent methyltransferase